MTSENSNFDLRQAENYASPLTVVDFRSRVADLWGGEPLMSLDPSLELEPADFLLKRENIKGGLIKFRAFHRKIELDGNEADDSILIRSVYGALEGTEEKKHLYSAVFRSIRKGQIDFNPKDARIYVYIYLSNLIGAITQVGKYKDLQEDYSGLLLETREIHPSLYDSLTEYMLSEDQQLFLEGLIDGLDETIFYSATGLSSDGLARRVLDQETTPEELLTI